MNRSFQKFFNFLALSLIITIMMSCGDTKKQSAGGEVEFSEAEEKIAADIDKVIHDLPPPSEVPYMLQAAGADFNGDLVNSIDKVDSYLSDEDKAALNLGIYTTDIGYLTSYDKVQESANYLEACQKLAENLGIASIFSVEMAQRFQDNMSNKDTLTSLMNEAILKAEESLEQSDRLTVGALILSGSFIEGLYLSVMVIETYPDDVLDEQTKNLILEGLIKAVLDQKKSLLDVIAMLKDIPHDDTIRKIISELNILRLLYDGDLAEIDQQIKSNEGDFVLKADMLFDITTEVRRIRGEMVN